MMTAEPGKSRDTDLASWIASLPPEWIADVDVSAIERAHAAYQSPGRHYHTWNHVVACVDQLRFTPCEHPRAVFLALVFHDAVYVAGKPDNEEQSAFFAREVLSASSALDAGEIASIEPMILATQHHVAQGDETWDDAILIDIDLSILSASRAAYSQYARQIHDEWVPVPVSESAYRIGRLEFLRKTLAAKFVYVTPDARSRWEEAARANMSWEIRELMSGLEPVIPAKAGLVS